MCLKAPFPFINRDSEKLNTYLRCNYTGSSRVKIEPKLGSVLSYHSLRGGSCMRWAIGKSLGLGLFIWT